MLLLSINTLIGFVGGAVTAVLSQKVYTFVKKQVTSIEAKEVAVKQTVANTVSSVVATVEKSKL